MTFTRRPIEVVEIVQPKCSRTFGVGVCEAVGVPCYNTDFTCKFRAALDLTETISLKFVENRANIWLEPSSELLTTEVGEGITTEAGVALTTDGGIPFQPSMAIPALSSYQSVPTVLNVAGGNQNFSPLGYRAVANISIRDFPYNDFEVDPYLADRTFDPITQGTFWTKWLARNPFHIGYIIRRYEGLEGQSLAEMIKREYVIERTAHGRNGVNIVAKDVLRRITENNVTVPALSTGVLSADITDSATTFTVSGANLDDYPASGWVRIGDELIAYTTRVTNASNIDFSGVTRAQLGSSASAHSQFDVVQTVVAYESEPFSDIINDLLTTYGGVSSSFIPLTDWTTEFNIWRPTFSFTAYLSVPEPVDKLVGEVCLQAQANVWWDERIQQIILKAQRPDSSGITLTDDAHIIAGSYTIKEKPEERVSQVWTYYNLRNWADDPEDITKYARASSRIDVDKQIQYGGEVAVRVIPARWIDNEILATNLTLSYLQRFKDVRREVTFQLGAEDGLTYWTGDGVNLDHYLDVGVTGARKVSNWLITSAEASMPNGVYTFVAEDNGTAGVLWEWVDEAVEPAFDAATEDDKQRIGYWLNDDGTDADGTARPFRWL